MTLKSPFLILGILLFRHLTFCQDGKLFFIKDKDTVKVAENNIKVFIEFSNGLLRFNQGDNLIYPNSINLDSINSIIVVYNNDSSSFFNFNEMVKSSRLPLPIIKLQLPIYSSVFSDRRNMYFTIDKYPYENKDRKQTATMNLKNSNVRLNKMTISELYYQVTEIHLYEPKKKNNR
jgi:hypothetical protein